MFINIKRDFTKTLKQQIKEGINNGWEYIGVFGTGEKSVLKFLDKNK